MPHPRYSFFHAAIHVFASSRFGSWLLAHTLQFQDQVVLALTGGRWTATGLLAGLPVVWVTTTGARSGKPRTTPLLGIRDEASSPAFAVIGTNWGQQHYPAWYHNLKANPRVTCTVQGQTGSYVAHEAKDQEYEKLWRRAAEVYRGYPLYKQRIQKRHIPILVLTPAQR